MNSRRDFLRKAALGSLAAVSIPQIVSAAMTKKENAKITIEKEQTILFQGDSITDAGRNREDTGSNSSRALGTGYAFIAGASLLEKYSAMNPKVFNRGISGNKVYQLAERWDADCINLKPDILSILIGVNDFWHTLGGNYNGTIAVYKRDYVALIERTLKVLPDVKLIICEPFAVQGVKAVDDKWYPAFPEYQKAAREVSIQFGAVFIPFQKLFDEACKAVPGSFWTTDGVHASPAGASLMAHAWLSVLK